MNHNSLQFSFSLNLEQLDLKDQCGISWDLGRGATSSISEVRWDDQLPLLTHTHSQQTLVPTW